MNGNPQGENTPSVSQAGNGGGVIARRQTWGPPPKYFNGRFARYLLTKHLLSKSRFLRQRYGIHPQGVRLEDVATALLWDRVDREAFALTDQDRRHLAAYPEDTFVLDAEGRLELSSRVHVYKVSDCAVLGRDFSFLHRPSDKIILRTGHLDDPNRVVPHRYRSTLEVPGVAVPLHGEHYFHFTLDGLRRLCECLRHDETLHAATILMRPTLQPYQQSARAFLEAHYPSLKFLHVAADCKVLCEHLLLRTRERPAVIDTFANGGSIRGVRDHYLDHYRVTRATPHRRLLIDRNREKRRNLLNQDRLTAALRPLGFETVDPGVLDHADQVRLFSDAEAVVAVEGSALTNLIYCQPGTRVLEIRPDRLRFPFWIGLCKQLGLHHRGVIGTTAGRHMHVTVDVDDVRHQVSEMVG